jgi:hypothetical protein
MRVLALSLVTNKAVLAPVPRGDDHLLQHSTLDELNTIVEEGRANHQEVLKEGHHAATDMEVCQASRFPALGIISDPRTQKLVGKILEDIYAHAQK